MPWPVYASVDPGITEGTIYCNAAVIHHAVERHGYKGQAWKMGAEYTAYVPNQKLVYKSAKRLGELTEQDFWYLMGTCRQRNLKPPSSYADLFFQHYRVPRLPVRTFLTPFRAFTFGGWQAAIWTGSYRGPVWHYDINSAYRWAACGGLPDMETARRSYRFDDPIGVYIVELDAKSLPYAEWDGVHMVTSEERDYFKLRPRSVLLGVRFERHHDMTPTFQGLDTSWPRDVVKRMARAFWGKFNTPTGPQQVTWKHGPKETPHSNHMFNPTWAAFITSRVKMRLENFRMYALHYFVDSILSTEELPSGAGVGEFKLVGSYGAGVYIKAPGWWADGPANVGKWIKHAGVRYSDASVN